jgi:cytochrome c oxidase subunit II
MRGRPVIAMVAAGVATTAALLAVALSVRWFPTPASTRAPQVRTLYDVLLIVSVPIFVTVCVVVVTAVIRFRMRPGQEDMDGPPIHGNTLLEVTWTTIPALLILSLCVYSYVVLHDIEAAPAKGAPRQLDIGVTAQQFAWSFTYPPSVTGGAPLTTTTLELPIGRSAYFSMHSEDVIHSFWVPNFAAKEDVVPGITTHVRATPDRLGTYPIVCAELCGIGHAFMRSSVSVVTPGAFAAWLHRRAGPAVPASAGTRGLVAAGRATFTGTAGCAGCHALADAHATGTIGPNLDVGLKGRTAAFIRQCITNPNSVAPPGYPKNVMPATFARSLTNAQITALVTYLKTVAGR